MAERQLHRDAKGRPHGKRAFERKPESSEAPWGRGVQAEEAAMAKAQRQEPLGESGHQQGPECNASAAEERETPQPGTASGFYGDREEALGRGGMGADLCEGGKSRRDTVQCDKSTAGHSGTGTGVRDVSPTGSPKQVGRCSGERHVCAHRRAHVSGRGEGKEENDS